MKKISVQLKANKEGMILLTILIISIVLSILALGIISMNVNAVSTSQGEVDRIKAEQLAKGVSWVAYSSLASYGSINSMNVINATLDNKTYSTSRSSGISTSGPFQTDPYTVTINY